VLCTSADQYGVGPLAHQHEISLTIKNFLPEGSTLTQQNIIDAQAAATQNSFANTKVEPTRARASRSTLAGLRHIQMACEGAGGSFNIAVNPGDSSVLVTIKFPAHVFVAQNKTFTSASAGHAIDKATEPSHVLKPFSRLNLAPTKNTVEESSLSDLRIFAIDDSKV
jgi:hypothetical protein